MASNVGNGNTVYALGGLNSASNLGGGQNVVYAAGVAITPTTSAAATMSSKWLRVSSD